MNSRVILAVSLMVLLLPLMSAGSAVSADSLKDTCLGTNGGLPPIFAALKDAKSNLAAGHYAIAKKQSSALQKTALDCIAANYQPDVYHYAHGFGLLIQAQAQLALGEPSGKASMERGVDEEDGLATNDNIDPGLQKLAKDAAYGGKLELKQLLDARKGDLFTPPPTAPPH